ncbi:SCO family protein [Engelhardtia mirabilis]|uniref:SCO family protein n=1 Tax=Engelhardtia mirabilis TaxID=2528011 RepID=A0A518BH70_9BACT|nr:hypothetical protein Pla133_13400 [Planctomycetes bacterium Pla133]QDV00599.1 hypothetical protein Pla86_13390 [Planctomycetes bacterium Pla86]
MNAFTRTRTLLATVALATAVGLSSPAVAYGPVRAVQVNDAVPEDTAGVGVEQRLGEQVPTDVPFTDHLGERVTFGDCFQSGRPVILTLNYSDCPMLCGMQLDGLIDVLNQLGWVVGEDFDVVTVSIDENELFTKAAATREHYLNRYVHRAEMPDGDGGWHFLVGQQSSIDAVAQAVGFGYRFVPSTGEFAHEAAIMLLTPEAVVSRYLFGVSFEEPTLRLSLVEASDGKLGGIAERITMMCFVYDPTSGSYVAEALSVMKLGGLVTVVVLGGFLLIFWRKELIGVLGSRRSGPRTEKTLEGVS